MLIHEKDEVIISELMYDIDSYIEKKENKYIFDFRKKLENILATQPNDFIYHLSDLIYSYYEDEETLRLFDNNLKDIIETSENNDKQHLVIAIPFLLYGYQSMTDLEFVRTKNFFDNRLFKTRLNIENILKNNLHSQYDFNIKVHDSFVDVNCLYQKYKELFALKDQLQKNKEDISKQSLLNIMPYERLVTEKKDNLKFILAVIELDKKESLSNVIENSFKSIFEDYNGLRNEMDNLLINQQINFEEYIMLPPCPLMDAIDMGESEFHYYLLFNTIKNVFQDRKKQDVISTILFDSKKPSIEILFFDNNESQNLAFYKVALQNIAINYEEELRNILDIMDELGINYRLIKE